MSTISSKEQVTFPQFRKSLNAIIDTGATSSSIHASDIQVNGSQVSFVNQNLSDNVITLPMAGNVTVKTADSDSARPVVKLSVQLGDQTFDEVAFSLNDRSDMDQGVLIGRDLLERGQFAVQVVEAKDKDKDESANYKVMSPEIATTEALLERLDALTELAEDLHKQATDELKRMREEIERMEAYLKSVG